MRQKGFAPIFILIGALIAVTIIGATYKYYQNNKVKNQNIPQSGQFNSPKPSASSEEKTVETNLEPLKTETKKQLNPSGTLAFYFTSDKPAFRPGDYDYSNFQDDPLKITYNGDTYYFTTNYLPDVTSDRFIIRPRVLNLKTEQETNLSAIGDIPNGNGSAKVTRWVDDTHLIEKSCGDLCRYNLIDVQKNVAELLGSGGVFGVGWRVDSVKHPEFYKGEIIENRAGSFVFVQNCEKKDVCKPIQIFKDIPKDVYLFPYEPFKPFMTITTTKQMKEVDFEDPENLAFLNRRVRIYVGEGYFVFDLQQEKIINSQVPN